MQPPQEWVAQEECDVQGLGQDRLASLQKRRNEHDMPGVEFVFVRKLNA